MSHRSTRLARTRSFPRSLAILLSTLVVATGLFALPASPASAAPATLWGREAPAGVVLGRDTAAVELGTVFQPKVSGKVTGIRFYKAKGAKGKHIGTLWTKAGKKLARVTFKKETASGWQTAKLAKAVKLTAGRSYVVSYHVPKGGRYGSTPDSTRFSATSALTVKKATGVYTYKKSVAFPKSSMRARQYWVDVNFTPDSATLPSSSSSASVPVSSGGSSAPVVGSGVFPTRTSVGLPAGWKPVQEVTGDYWIRTPGAVVEDLRVTDGTIYVDAANVTLRRVQGRGAFVKTDVGSSCRSGLVVEDSEFVKSGGTSDADPPVIGQGGFTVRRTVIDGMPEGIRAGAGDIGCGPVVVEDSFVRVVSPDSCGDWHGDGLQGYGGGKVTVRRSTMIMDVVNDCYGTAPFFYPSGQGNTSVDIDGLLVSGGGYPFRNGMPGTVKNLSVVEGSWVYGPVDVKCSVLSAWQAQVVKLNSDGSTTPVRSIACTGQGN